MNNQMQNCQSLLASFTDQIAWNQVELGFLSLETAEEFQAKRREIETRRAELRNQHDMASARAVRLHTVLRPSDRAVAKAQSRRPG